MIIIQPCLGRSLSSLLCCAIFTLGTIQYPHRSARAEHTAAVFGEGVQSMEAIITRCGRTSDTCLRLLRLPLGLTNTAQMASVVFLCSLPLLLVVEEEAGGSSRPHIEAVMGMQESNVRPTDTPNTLFKTGAFIIETILFHSDKHVLSNLDLPQQKLQTKLQDCTVAQQVLLLPDKINAGPRTD